MKIGLHGVIPPVPTIIGDDGRFDPVGMGKLIDRLLASEINGFLFLGSAGEFAQLSNPARKEIAEFCVKRVAGRRPVIIGTASCHTEGGLILEQWLKQGYYGTGHNPAEGLLDELAGAWKHSRARPFVHIMQDKDLEENYHAKFIQRSLTQAGFESKILFGLDELRWDAAGQLIDADGRLVNCVWKTWAWETAIEQVREVSADEYAAVPIRTGHPQNEVRLIDVLLRPEVLVFEPLWTVIPGNKAILPVLWSLFPHHRYLLDTDFVVNDELAKTGYAVKPISGRCGNNIDLIGPQDEVLDKTSGQFVDRKNIYQQLWCLPKVDGKYIQVCTFTVGGNYGGTCLRGDSSLVVKKESDIEPLIVLKDKA